MPGSFNARCGISDCLTIRSPSKINVFLEVLGKRSDGFHDLETVMLRTQPADVLQFRAVESDQLSLTLAAGTSPAIATGFPLDGSNLILRAANALRDACGVRFGAHITAAKKVPPESGLAGGSGNAAATLLALNRLWRLNLTQVELHRLAETLGSDINFLLSGCRAAICRGRGESVEQIPLRGRFYFVSVRPRTGNSTAAVFRRLPPPTDRRCPEKIVQNLCGGFSSAFAMSLFNRLTEPAMSVNSELAGLVQRVRKTLGLELHVSGSGSTCVAAAANYRQAVVFASRLWAVTGLTPNILWS